MSDKERRHPEWAKRGSQLKRELTDDQLFALRELETFGWELKFIRHPMFEPPVAVVFDSDRSHYAVLEKDGTLNEHPSFDIRH